MLDVAVKVVFLRELGREPMPFELDEFVLYSYDRAQTLLRQTPEYLAKHDPEYKGDVYYHSGSHLVRVRTPAPTNYKGVLVGNGKVCVRTTAHHERCERMGVTFVPEMVANTTGVRQPNLIRAWSALGGHIRIGQDHASDVVLQYEQHLDCRRAVFESFYTTKVRTSGVDETFRVHKALLSPRQYPYGFYVRYAIAGSTHPFEFDHMWQSFPEDMHQCTVASNKLGKRVVVSASAMYTRSDHGEDRIEAVAVYSVRSIDEDGVSIALPVSIVMDQTDAHNNVARVHDLVIPPNGRIEIEIFMSLTSSHDFPRPDIDAMRIALSMREDISLRTNHYAAWKLMWNSDIEIDARSGISAEETVSLNMHRRYHKVNLYTLYSTMRYDAFEGFEPLNVLAIDEYGDRLWEAELHLLPVLVVMNPTLARILLDYRFKQLEQGKKDARALGHNGARIPHIGPSDYNRGVYTNTKGAYLHSTALVGIHAWNYFRRTTDREWLLTRGYKIMKHCTRYMLDQLVITRDDIGRILSASLVDSMDIDGEIRTNLTLVVYTTYALLKFTIEATYELNYNFVNHQDWIDIHEYLRTVFSTPESMGASVEMTEADVLGAADIDAADIDDTDASTSAIVRPIENAFTTGNRPLPVRVSIRLQNMTLYLDDVTTDPPTPLGFMFGGYSGFKLRIDPEIVYTFVLEDTTPIEFFDASGNRMNATMLLAESTATYNSVIDQGYHSGTVVVTGVSVRSYASVRAHTVFGTNAFSTGETNTALSSIVYPYAGYTAMDPVGRAEPMLLLSNYYSRIIYSNMTINPVGRAGAMLRDNANYYHVVSDMTLPFNMLSYASAYATVAQRDFVSSARRANINVYDATMLRHFDTATASPWGEDPHYPIGIFTMLDGLMGFSVRGRVNSARYYIEMYSLTTNNANVLPSYWNELRVYTNEQARGRRVYTMFNSVTHTATG